MEVIKVGDTEGHVIQVTESKGVDVRSKNLAICHQYLGFSEGNRNDVWLHNHNGARWQAYKVS